MKKFFSILLWLWPVCGCTQSKDSLQIVSSKNSTIHSPQKAKEGKENKPEIFSSGFIDIISNGQLNASARFIRLYIGEPDKFMIPLSFYSGVSSNSFQNGSSSSQRNNEALVTNFINPLSGLLNISLDGVVYLNKSKIKVTKAGFLYHAGERVLTGLRTGLASNPSTGKPLNFLNSFFSTGVYFQTGAWERNNKKNVGVTWLAIRQIGCYTNPKQLKEMMPAIKTNGLYLGYSIAWGVEISKLLNIKLVYYKYQKKPEIDYYLPIYQFSFNYSLK